MFRLGRDKLQKRATSFGVDRSQAGSLFEALDLVKGRLVRPVTGTPP